MVISKMFGTMVVIYLMNLYCGIKLTTWEKNCMYIIRFITHLLCF